MKKLCLTNCKLHCGVRGVSFAGFSQHRSVLPDRNELRNPQRQLTSDRYGVLKEKQPTKESKYEKETNYYLNLDFSISAIF